MMLNIAECGLPRIVGVRHEAVAMDARMEPAPNRDQIETSWTIFMIIYRA